MLVFSALVAGSFALGALAANDISPLALNTVRFWIAAVVVGGVALATGGLRRQSLKAPWRYVVLAFPFVTYFVLMFEGLKTAPPVSLAAIFTFTPIMSAGLGWLLLRQKMTMRMGVALLIGGFGALWVIFRGDLHALLTMALGRGEWIYFVGCIAHAIFTPLVAKLNRGETALESTFLTIIVSAILLTVWSWRDLMATQWLALPDIVWITISYTSVMASAATFTLLQFAALRLPSSKVMAYTYLTPTWVIAWTLAMGQAAPTIWITLGIGLTIVALVLLLKDESAART